MLAKRSAGTGNNDCEESSFGSYPSNTDIATSEFSLGDDTINAFYGRGGKMRVLRGAWSTAQYTPQNKVFFTYTKPLESWGYEEGCNTGSNILGVAQTGTGFGNGQMGNCKSQNYCSNEADGTYVEAKSYGSSQTGSPSAVGSHRGWQTMGEDTACENYVIGCYYGNTYVAAEWLLDG